jgi:hypothetical protein
MLYAITVSYEIISGCRMLQALRACNACFARSTTFTAGLDFDGRHGFGHLESTP